MPVRCNGKKAIRLRDKGLLKSHLKNKNVMVSLRLDFLTRHNEKNVGEQTALMNTA